MSANVPFKERQLLKEKLSKIRKEDTENATVFSSVKPKLDQEYEEFHNLMLSEIEIKHLEPLNTEEDILNQAVKITNH
jgi:hypothetical protein